MRLDASFLSVPEIATRLGVKSDKVLQWIASGQLRGINVAERVAQRPRWRISEADLEAFLEVRSTRKTVAVPRGAKPPKRTPGIKFF